MEYEQNPKRVKVEAVLPLGSMPTNEEELRGLLNEMQGLETPEGRKSFEEYSNLKKRDYKRLNKIRDKMVSKYTGLNLETLREYHRAKGVNTSGIASANDQHIINMNTGSTKKINSILDGVGLTVAGAFGFLGLLCGGPLLTAVTIGATLYAPFAFSKALFKHGERLSNLDPQDREKQRELLKTLEPYRARIDGLNKEIEKNYDLIERNRKSMDKKEFEAWKNNFMRAMCERVEARCAFAGQREV